MTLQQYLEDKNQGSAFQISQSDIDYIITFSNTGKAGSIKQFTLGLESFISILNDIKANITAFKPHENYVEKAWRDLGSKYYTDGPANSMSTVQTKPLFATVSKIISWANSPDLDTIDCDQFLKVGEIELTNAIDKLEDLRNGSINHAYEVPEFKEHDKIDFNRYFAKFNNATFETIRTSYALYFNDVFEKEKEWMYPTEQKLNFIKLSTDREALKDVIEKLRNESYTFTQADENSLSTFSRVIDKTINASNFINNFTNENLKKNHTTLHDFFNEMKKSVTLSDLKKEVTLTGTLSSFLPFYYSAVKFTQSPTLYPVYYKYWFTCYNSFFNGETDYDSLSAYYRTFPETDRHINFCAFWGALGKAVLYDIKSDLGILDKDSKAYRKLFKLIPSEKYLNEIFATSREITPQKNVFKHSEYLHSSQLANLYIDKDIALRFSASLLTKPFVILTGLSGSGKTKLAQSFATWICAAGDQYCIVPVGADWTNREPLLGFPNALMPNEYKPDEYGVLQLILRAGNNPGNPYFLILDEMNLSHVERYFADFLSVMESKASISLHSGDQDWNGIPADLSFPKNLFIIGTVNIDETTYMFSPKVLDRANVIEFRVTEAEMRGYLAGTSVPRLQNLAGLGASMADSFVEIAGDENLITSNSQSLTDALMKFFTELKKTGAEFGYRSASEILRFSAVVKKIAPEWQSGESIDNAIIHDAIIDAAIIDAAIMQKLLPKVHGSKRKLEPVLKTLGTLCLTDAQKFDDIPTDRNTFNYADRSKVQYPLSLEKILRMYDNLNSNGFTSYAEA